MNTPPDIVQFFARFHPVLVHLPIGFIVLLTGFELMACWPRFKDANVSAGYVLALAAPAAIVSAVCGWMLALSNGYDAHLLAVHRWAGITTALLCTITAVLYRCGWQKAYRIGLGATVCTVAVAGHFGASLTHGSDYLFAHAPALLRALFSEKIVSRGQAEPVEIADRRVFAGVVQPILREKCLACHNPQKRKGGLRFDTIQGILQGGEDGAVVVPGHAVQSEMIKRLRLPPEDENHMPPAGKSQLSAGEIALLEWWINAGASADKMVRELDPSLDTQRMLDRMAAMRNGRKNRPEMKVRE